MDTVPASAGGGDAPPPDAAPEFRYLFEFHPESKKLFPALDMDGREPDGVRLLTLADAARVSGRTPDHLADDWLATFGDVVKARGGTVEAVPGVAGEPPPIEPSPAQEQPPGRTWRRDEFPMSKGGSLTKSLPSDAIVCLARPGMIVLLDVRYGIIEAIHADGCVVECEDGSQHWLTWGELDITHVRPDPAYLGGDRRDDDGLSALPDKRSRVAITAAMTMDGANQRLQELLFDLPDHLKDDLIPIVDRMGELSRKLWSLSRCVHEFGLWPAAGGGE